jgi:glycosyltransferase involved in cell wall biosynthesis
MLTVLSVAFPFAPVGTAAVGGAERILTELDRALVTAGSGSIVVACEGSDAAGKLYSFPAPGQATLDDVAQAEYRQQCEAAIHRALNAERVELIHMHNMDFWQYRLPPDIPVLVTLHLPIRWYPAGVWNSGSHFHFCCVSESQRRTCPPELECEVIENGVPLPPCLNVRRENFALVIGRICPEKNAHAALEAGTLAGVPVVLAGQVFPYPEHRQYMREKIEPLLAQYKNGIRHSYIGPATSNELRNLLSRARCLLHPTLAPETSSLVAMEALASGTPVIAYPYGALPEIVIHGRTGFLVHTPHEMSHAIRNVDTLSHEVCRAEAERRFGIDRMVQKYFRFYERILHAVREPEVQCYA